MPIPALDETGLLPVGVHDCTLDEVGECFGGSSDGPRREIFNGLVRWRSMLMRRNLPVEIFVDGSFTTSKAQPDDVDVAIRLPPPTLPMLRAVRECTDLFNSEVSKPSFRVDPWLFYYGDDGPDPTDYVRLFSQMKPEEARRHGVPAGHVRGILRITP